MHFYLHISIFCSTFAPAFEKKARKDGGVVYRVGLENRSTETYRGFESLSFRMKNYSMLAKTFKGLEEVLAQELIELGANDVLIERRAVSFMGDKAMLYRANLCLRTATRILVEIAKPQTLKISKNTKYLIF